VPLSEEFIRKSTELRDWKPTGSIAVTVKLDEGSEGRATETEGVEYGFTISVNGKVWVIVPSERVTVAVTVPGSVEAVVDSE